MRHAKFNISLLVILTVLFGSTVDAQHKEMRKALSAFNDLQYFQAAEEYKKTLEKITEDKLMQDHAIFMIGECYRMMNDPAQAGNWYEQLSGSNYGDGRPAYYLHYADILRAQGKVAEARDYYRKYLKTDPQHQQAKMGLKSCDWIQANGSKRAQVNVTALSGVNSDRDDFAPVFYSGDFDRLVITSNRQGVTGKYIDQWHGAGYSDLFLSSRTGNGWTIPVLFDATGIINTEMHEGTPAFNGDHSVMYFTRCARSAEKMAFCQILRSARQDDLWAEPQVVFSDTAANIGHPSVSKDELTIFFSSDLNGSEGGNDIWMATRTARDQSFGVPAQVRGINTTGEEMFPYLYNDTLLFFASDGWEGYGGLDIYQSTFRNNKWSAPVNLLRPVNSGYDDFGIIIKILGEEGYFTSNRPNGIGGDDIYGFTRRTMLFTVSGQVKDQMTLLPLENAQALLISEKGDTTLAYTTERGKFHFDTTRVKEYRDYELLVRKDNYFARKESFTTKIYNDDHDLVIDFQLEPIPDQPIVLPDILYALDDWRLQPQYQDSLMQLVDLLRINENLVIELRSHTDSRASYEYNDVLSQKRAQSVVDFLISQGIDPRRLVAKGYGERVFRILNKDIYKENHLFKAGTELNDQFVYALSSKEIQEAAFQLNRRTEFSVLSKDYKPDGEPFEGQKPIIELITE